MKSSWSCRGFAPAGAGVLPNYSAGAPEDHADDADSPSQAPLAEIFKKERVQECRLPTAWAVLRAGRIFSRPRRFSMDSLLLTIWNPGRKARRLEDSWLDPPAAGFGRLLMAATIVGIVAGVLDHVAAIEGKPDRIVGASYGSSTEGSSK